MPGTLFDIVKTFGRDAQAAVRVKTTPAYTAHPKRFVLNSIAPPVVARKADLACLSRL